MSNQELSQNYPFTGKNSKKQPPKKDFYEGLAWGSQKLVCGIDEVGRGCLAGPLIAAAAILKKQQKSPLLKDSKLLSQLELETSYAWLIEHAWFGVGIIDNNNIDQVNIYQATLLAMQKALSNLCAIAPQHPSFILIDAMPLNLAHTAYKNIPLYYFPKGETYSCSIAAASIIAKVTRDRLMKKFAPLFPGYSFESHKGYGTKAHQIELQTHGRSLLHRRSFIKKLMRERTNSEQQTLC